jgi:hypothetical protein
MLAANGPTKTSVGAWDTQTDGDEVRVAYNKATEKGLENV